LKSANAPFAIAADARGVKAFSVHPGAIITGLTKFMAQDEKDFLVQRATVKTPEQGAATTVWCAVSRQLDHAGGVYCQDCNIAEPVRGDPQGPALGVRPWAIDPALAEQLWALSKKITGLGVG
jgi:hypothetical protein